MRKKQTESLDAAEQRRRAEKILSKRKKETTPPEASDMDIRRLFHELEVHQIELEMQNEELIKARAELEATLREYTNLYDFAKVGYFTLDRTGKILQVNLKGAHLLGVERTNLKMRRFGQFISPDSFLSFNAFLKKIFENRSKETCEVTLLKEGNEPLYLEIEARISENEEECRAVAEDISARKRVEQELRYMSMHDALTGLYNRGFFEEEMARLERGRQFPISIVMADVDHLKKTNDHEGHIVGDTLLKRVAQVLTATFRTEDIVARIGGDEFAVLLANADVKAVETALHRLQHIIQEHNAAYAGVPLCLSFGASTAEKPAPLANLLREADENMYRAKRGHDVSD
ncbi:MAG: GGDEF domain-containing protein [Anaerolineales bacterium]|nr:GGDEF domain-containing protein [Anaerolineales bacterium]